MSHQLPRDEKMLSCRKKAIQQYISAAAGGLLALSLSTTGAAAKEQATKKNVYTASTSTTELSIGDVAGRKQTRPTLRNLLESIPPRPTEPSTEPLDAPATEPATTSPGGSTVEPGSTDSATQTVRLLLKLSERKVYVYRGESVEAVYPVAVGRTGWETPTGEFSVLHQVVDPGWTNPLTGEEMPPGPDNPLGDRWIMFWTDDVNAIGFHGTPNRESVGTAASHGCIRMYNEDVRELYEIVSVGTPVIVEE